MADMFDYLYWRGDILFSQLPPNPVDALIFSALSYLKLDGIVSENPYQWKTIERVAEEFLALPDAEDRIHLKKDMELLKMAADSPRFKRVGITFYQDVFIPEEDTQFAAVTFYLEDGTAFLAFRGTDNTLVGWKEDFNMTFQECIPAQRLAKEYVQKFAESSDSPMRLGGHSKGGNLAVYAAAKSSQDIQRRMLAIYNQDGPGFTEHLMGDKGYLVIVPKIYTYVPQSSVFGMLLEHEEPYTIIKSKQIGLMQHDIYSWEIKGKDFITVEKLTADSRFLDRTFRNWLAGMSNADRNEFFDTVFELLAVTEPNKAQDIIRPQNVYTYLKTLRHDESMRKIIASELVELVKAAKNRS